MTPAAILNEARAAGVTLWAEGDALRYRGPREALAKLLPALKAHKPAILAMLAERAKCSHVDDLADADYDDPALTQYDSAYQRRAAAEPGYDAPAQARYCCECANLAEDRRCLAFERLGAPESWRPSDRRPRRCRGFQEASIAREAEDLKEFFEERAGILEHDAGLPRAQAEIEAARITSALARNRGYLWASLRAALAEYPALLTVLPDEPGQVDALPFGVAKVAVLPGRRVVRQGAFDGAQEMKA